MTLCVIASCPTPSEILYFALSMAPSLRMLLHVVITLWWWPVAWPRYWQTDHMVLSREQQWQAQMQSRGSLSHPTTWCHHESWSGIPSVPHLHPGPSSSVCITDHHQSVIMTFRSRSKRRSFSFQSRLRLLSLVSFVSQEKLLQRLSEYTEKTAEASRRDTRHEAKGWVSKG